MRFKENLKQKENLSLSTADMLLAVSNYWYIENRLFCLARAHSLPHKPLADHSNKKLDKQNLQIEVLSLKIKQFISFFSFFVKVP
jgi:hypothetical protein